jgi:hypothetical protein
MKLRCTRFRRELERCADTPDGLPTGSPAARHVEACDDCRAAWTGLRRLGSELRHAIAVPPPATSLEQSTWARMAMARSQRPVSHGRSLVFGAAAVAVVVAAALALQFRPKGALLTREAVRIRPGSGTTRIAESTSGRRPPQRPAVNDGTASWEGRLKPAGHAKPSSHAQARSRAFPIDRRVVHGPLLPGPALNPAASHPPPPPIPDAQFLDGRDPSLLAQWSPVDGKEQALVASILRRLPPPADDFVRLPLPRIAAGGSGRTAVAAAAREYEREAKVVDSRLFRKITLQEKGVSLTDLCAHLQEQTGVELRVSHGVADEKVTVFVKEQRARDVMRAVAHLFGYLWSRSGAEDDYRYTIEQDLRSQLAEEELRNRDRNAALLALDAQMQKYRPYLEMSFEELQKRGNEGGNHWKELSPPERENAHRLAILTLNTGWGGMQLYHRLTPSDRAALIAGQELVFRPDAPNPDYRLPAEWNRPILQSWGGGTDSNGRYTQMADIPDIKVNQVRLKLNRSELGQVSLSVNTAAVWSGSRTYYPLEMATGHSPSAERADNTTANVTLRHHPPFEQLVSLRPEPSCPRLKRGKPDVWERNFYSVSLGTLDQPHVFSGDVWEAVHRETGLPIVADFYTRMHRLDKVKMDHKPLFEALCTVGDALGVRWKKEGDFLLCRSTSYFWDKLKEVPNRYLQRWARDRDANGGLPLADLLEMASLPEQQLDSPIVAEAIQHCWGLREWHYAADPLWRRQVRFLMVLTPEQQRRAMQPACLAFKELTPAQQQAAVQLQNSNLAEMERQGGEPTPIPADLWSHAEIYADYVPAGWYAWQEPMDRVAFGPGRPFGGRTAAEALAAVRRVYPPARSDWVQISRDGEFHAGVRFFACP